MQKPSVSKLFTATMVLADKIEQNPRSARAVYRRHFSYMREMKSILDIKDIPTRLRVANLLKEDYLREPSGSKIPMVVRTYYNNVVVARYRKFLKENT